MRDDILSAIRPSLTLTALFAILLGLLYPLAMTGVGQVAFPQQTNGSLIKEGNTIIGSELIGQNFTSDLYFHGRPSAAGKGYDATASSGSNFGPTSKPLVDRIKGDMATLEKQGNGPVPTDLLTASGSGLDPDITPEAAFFQVDRVAKARHIDAVRIQALVNQSIDHPLLGFLGEDRVNVLALNRALDVMEKKGS